MWLAVYDTLEDLVCAESGLYKLPTLQKLDKRACWRLYREDRTYAFLEGRLCLRWREAGKWTSGDMPRSWGVTSPWGFPT